MSLPCEYPAGILSAISEALCVDIHLSVLTNALASFWTVLLWLFTHSVCMYRLDDGYGPPNAASDPSGVRMSRSTLPESFSVMSVTVGSVVIPASMVPFWSAETNVGPAPTGTRVNSPTFTPFWTARYWVRKSVEEPRPVTPSFLPLNSLG